MPDVVRSLVTNTTPLISLAVGVLIKARQSGYDISIPEAIEPMREHGIWLSNEVVRYALAQQV